MIISSTEKHLTIGSVSFNKARIKAITKDQDIVIIDASGREDPETAPGNYMRVDYRTITQPQVFAGTDLLLAYLKRKAKPVQAPAISLVSASAITETTARINATIDNKNADTVITVEYGITAAYGQTKAGGTVSELGQVAIDLTGLLVYTPYFYRIKAVNSAGTVYLAGANFTTAYPAEFDAYLTRVSADAGLIRSNEFTKSYIAFLKNQGRYANVKLLITPEMGSKRRVSGINTYISKLHSPQLAANDAVQATELSQPFLAGNVAPNERYALSIPQNVGKNLSHPAIGFLSNQPWSMITIINWNGSAEIIAGGSLAGNAGANSNIYLSLQAINRIRFISEAGTEMLFNPDNSFIGKNTILVLVADGQGKLSLYKDGQLFQEISGGNTSFIFSKFLNAYNTGIERLFNGRAFSQIIQGGAINAAQVTAEYNFIRTWLPDISKVTIGPQQWATSNLDIARTPMGNLVNEVQINANLEKITQPINLSTGWLLISTGTVINNANSFSTTQAGGLVKYSQLVIGKWYRIRAVGSVSNGVFSVCNPFNVAGATFTGAFDSTAYVRWEADTGIFLRCSSGATVNLSTLSVQEVGWANSQELYDAVYTSTAGTVEQKTYAAVKAAAMWSYYENDPTKGAVYGKLYNWFAAKLFQTDIDYYNTANPTTPWGWRVNTVADWNTLISGQGGAAVAGGKLKTPGLTHWLVSNIGADNSSGFSCLPSGIRNILGAFAGISVRTAFNKVDEPAGNGMVIDNSLASIDTIASYFTYNKITGLPIRLIKS